VTDKPPEKVFKYVLERRLAAGGMGEVFLARDESNAKVCVIKRMLPNLMSDQQFVTMFLDEAKLAAQLNHPNIAPLYDFGMANGVLYLSMEYVPGANLRMVVKDHAARKVAFPFDAAARIMSQAALALDYAHTATTADGKPLKLVHRDVSPQNILLGNNGVVKLIDFGVAKAATASQTTAAGLIKGKYAYMSPEQVRGQTLDGRSDIFGLGLVLYELLACERAIPGRTDAEVAQNSLHMRFAPIRTKRPEIPEKLEAIINKALQKDARDRYQRASEMSSDLERFLADRRVSPTGAELAKLLPMPTEPAPSIQPQPVPSAPSGDPNVPWRDPVPSAPEIKRQKELAPTQTSAFWEHQQAQMTDVSTEEGLPPTQQLTPSQLPMKAKPSKTPDASEAPTMHVGDVKLPPPRPSAGKPVRISQQATPMPPRPSPGEAPTQHVKDLQLPPPPPPRPGPVPKPSLVIGRPEPSLGLSPMPPVPPPPRGGALSESAIQRAVRRSMLPWVISALVLVLGAAALVAGFVYVTRKAPGPQPAPVATPTPVAVPAPKPPVAEAPDAAVAIAPPPVKADKPPPVDSALVEVASTVPAKVAIDGAASGSAPVELSVSPGAHSLVFTDVATGLQHKRVITVAAGDHRREAWNPDKGKLVVRASPWAEVFIGEHSFGVTPMDAPIEVVAGRHQFRFVNTDTKRTVQRVVDVPANKETLVKVDLR
jgi:serine/threonine protein kinase